MIFRRVFGDPGKMRKTETAYTDNDTAFVMAIAGQ